MRSRSLALAVTAALAACAAPDPRAAPAQAPQLAGRVAGSAQQCVAIRQNDGLRVADDDRSTLLYGSGTTLWANHLGAGCRFRPNDVPVVERTGSQYCRGDIVRSIDLVSGIPGPACVLGDFVPYSR